MRALGQYRDLTVSLSELLWESRLTLAVAGEVPELRALLIPRSYAGPGTDRFSRWYDVDCNDPTLLWSLLDQPSRDALLACATRLTLHPGYACTSWVGEVPVELAMSWLDLLATVATGGARRRERWRRLAEQLGGYLAPNAYGEPGIVVSRREGHAWIDVWRDARGTRTLVVVPRVPGEWFRFQSHASHPLGREQRVDVPTGYWAASNHPERTLQRFSPLVHGLVGEVQPEWVRADDERLAMVLRWIVEEPERLRLALDLADALQDDGSRDSPYR